MEKSGKPLLLRRCFKISDLQDTLTNLQQVSLDVSNYFTKLTYLWENIDSLHPTCDCTCDIPFTCSVASDLRKYKTQDHIIKFLNGLNDSFSMVHSYIFLLDPMASLYKTFSILLRQECLFMNLSLPDNLTMEMHFHHTNPYGGACGANSNHGGGWSNKGHGSSSNRVCAYYGCTNHTVDTCFIKHGYPSGYSYKSSKAFINSITNCAPLEDTFTHPQDFSITMASLRD